jgi:hypothetical protein
VPILADDANWGLDGVQLFDRIVEAREAGDWKNVSAREGLLDSLEPAYEIPRDNLNTVLNKAGESHGSLRTCQTRPDRRRNRDRFAIGSGPPTPGASRPRS